MPDYEETWKSHLARCGGDLSNAVIFIREAVNQPDKKMASYYLKKIDDAIDRARAGFNEALKLGD